MERGLAVRWILAGLALASLCFGCKGANELSGPGQGASAPPDLSGFWSGAFTSAKGGHCGPAQASIQQKGGNLVAEISPATCGKDGLYKGTVSANQLSGDVYIQNTEPGGRDQDGDPVETVVTLFGHLTGAFDPSAHTLTLTIGDLCMDDGSNCVEGGTLTLRRPPAGTE